MQHLGARRHSLGRRLARFFAFLLLTVALGCGLWLHAIGELAWSGPRTFYFVYLGGLLIVVVLLARWPLLAWTALVLALVELSWGMGSFVLERSGSETASLLPPSVGETERFQWHPLLQAVPIPSISITSATGLQINHTSQGTRGREPKPGDVEGHIVVATYGGSTTYDIGVGEGDTWTDRLADALGRDRYFAVNNGVPGYTTVEHVLQTAFYQDKFGRPPRCAIYYVGWNDLRNAHIAGLDPAYADFHLISQVDSLKLRRVGGSNVTFSPALTLLARIIGNMVDTVHYPDGHDPYAQPRGQGEDPVLAADFERNVRTISQINRGRGIATLWVGQLINRPAFTSEGRYGWLPLLRDRDVPPVLQSLNDRLARAAGALGDPFVGIPPETFGAADFVDNGHFSVQGARRFAEALLPTLREACR
jgi:lysophospholipase L1-like esterase